MAREIVSISTARNGHIVVTYNDDTSDDFPLDLQPGADGADGAPGADGVDGIDGINGVDGAVGPQGERGEPGPQGETGLKGEKGDQGVKGDTGAGLKVLGEKASQAELPNAGAIGDAWIVQGSLFVWNGAGYTNAGPFRGPKGDTGAQGIQGVAGPKGEPAPLRNRKIAILGHSKIAQNSIGRRYMAHGFITYACFRSRQRFTFEPEYNYGVPGDLPVAGSHGGFDYPGILNRLAGTVDAKFGSVPQDMLRTCDASVILIQAFTNYWNLATATAAEAVSIAKTMQDTILQSGRTLVWITDDPRGDSVGTGMRLSAANLTNALALRNWMLRQRAVPGVFVIDSWEALSNNGTATGDILDGYSYDSGLHLNQKGARRLGRLVSRTLDTIFEPINILPGGNGDRFSATNPSGTLNANAFLAGTGGSLNGHSGDIASSWASVPTNNGITYTFAKVNNATSFNGQPYMDQESKNWQQVTIGGSATNTESVVVLAQTITGLTVGDALRAVAELEIDSLVNVSSLMLSIYDNTNTVILAEDFSNTTDIAGQTMENVPDAGVMRTPSTMPISANSARIHIRVRAASAGAVSGVIRVRGMALARA